MLYAEQAETAEVEWNHAATAKRLRSRRRLDFRLKAIGLSAVVFALGVLSILILSLVSTGYPAFLQTHATLEVTIDPARVDRAAIDRGDFRGIVFDAIDAHFPEVDDRRTLRDVRNILSTGSPYILRDLVAATPSLIGSTVRISLPLSDPYDQLAKGLIQRETPEVNRRLKDDQIAWFDRLAAEGLVSKDFNWALFTNADSRFPELAGLKGAIVGSFYALLVCLLISFPVGIAAGVYLEEYAPKGRITDFIEVNINNLAAVPSIVFGLLALAVFLGWFGMPRSAPLVGGLTLSLMTLPTIIIATRAALKGVPPSIREAALAVGASPHQVTMSFVLPLAMPGILTGTIIGLAQALGETAPLLLIGMNAFITQAPDSLFQPATALPTQIFMWADSPERGFVTRTSAAILVLLMFLITMNAVAIYLRRKFERRW